MKRILVGLALVATMAAGGLAPSVSAKTRHHQKVKIEIRYKTPPACSTALADFRQAITQLSGGFTDIGHLYLFGGNLSAQTMISDMNAINAEITAETAPLQAAELACDGS